VSHRRRRLTRLHRPRHDQTFWDCSNNDNGGGGDRRTRASSRGLPGDLRLIGHHVLAE
jgi:hypothetical protein